MLEYVFYIFVGIALVILATCVLIDKLHKNNQEMHIDAKDKKVEICPAKEQIPNNKK